MLFSRNYFYCSIDSNQSKNENMLFPLDNLFLMSLSELEQIILDR